MEHPVTGPNPTQARIAQLDDEIDRLRAERRQLINAARHNAPPGMRKCSRCERVLALTGFYKQTRGGRHCWCTACFKDYMKTRYHARAGR